MLESVRNNIFTTTAQVVSSANKVVEILRKSAAEAATELKKEYVPEPVKQESLSDMRIKSALERLNPRARLDYAIQGGVLENPYLSALGVQ